MATAEVIFFKIRHLFLLDSTRVRPGFHKNIRTVRTFGGIVAKPWRNRIQIQFLVPGICQKLVESDLLAVFLLLFPGKFSTFDYFTKCNAPKDLFHLPPACFFNESSRHFRYLKTVFCIPVALLYYCMTYRTDRPAKTKTNRCSCLPWSQLATNNVCRLSTRVVFFYFIFKEVLLGVKKKLLEKF